MRDYAELHKRCGFVPALAATATVYKADNIIPTTIKEELEAAVSVLEDVPESAKDWHPGSDEKVLDLVHPSLFPLVYGFSKVLRPGYGNVLGTGNWEGKDGIVSLDDCEKWIGNGEVMPVPETEATHVESWWGRKIASHGQKLYSAKFQWLPCEVAFADNNAVKITSYINNLQPSQHKRLYGVLEQVITRVIPMWDKTLASIELEKEQPRIDLDGIPWIEPEGERPRGENEDEDEAWDLDEEWQRENRKLDPPEPGAYSERESALEEYSCDLRRDFAKHGLQIIVKLANIHLTPEKPSYDGGSWHIEGQLNEHICASALYYWSEENITDSYLSFREGISTDWLEEKPYEQGDHEHFELLYGIESEGCASQELGSVKTPENRVLTFPNVFQHRVSPFSLEDKTKPGHRKIVALFLVDPHTRIPSTANVPPQQKEWWKGMVHELDRVKRLPAELQEWITDSAGDVPFSLEEAKKLRLELMNERRSFVTENERMNDMESFSFCEH